MKNQNSFSSPHSSSKYVKLFNPNSSTVDQNLSRIKSILTKYLMPPSFNQQVSDTLSQLYSKIPRYESSVGFPDENRVGDFDPFWKQWLIFRDQISKLTDQSIIFFYQQFMNEKFDEFNEILEDLNTKPPQKVHLYREYDKSKKDIQTSFENLQQILLEQFDVDSEEDEDDKNPHKRIETIIKNLQSQRSKIRQIKNDVETKHRPFFINSAQDKELSEKQHQRCIKIIDEILVKTNELPKQNRQFNSINNELLKAEEKLKEDFPPNKVDVPSFGGKTNDENAKNNIDQIDHTTGQIEEEEEFLGEEEEEAFLEEENEYEEELESKQSNSIEKETAQIQNQGQSSPIRHPNQSMKKVPLTPPPTSKNPFKLNQTNPVNHGQQQPEEDYKQKRNQPNQKMPMTPQKKPPRLQLNNVNSLAFDDSDSYGQKGQNGAVKNPPQSAKPVQKLPHIKPLNLEDDALVDTFHGLSFSFSSSSSSSSDNERGENKKGGRSSRGSNGRNDRNNRSSNVNQRNGNKSSQPSTETTNTAHLSYRLFKNKASYKVTNTDPSVYGVGQRSGGNGRNGKNENDVTKNGYNGENSNVIDDDDVWSYRSNKSTPPSSPRGGPQPSHVQGSAAKMRSKSPSSSTMRRKIINNRKSSDFDDDEARPIGRPNSSLTNAPPSPAKRHLALNPEAERFHSVGGLIENETDSNEPIENGKGAEFNTQPSLPISPVRPVQSPKHQPHTPISTISNTNSTNNGPAAGSNTISAPSSARSSKSQKQPQISSTSSSSSLQQQQQQQAQQVQQVQQVQKVQRQSEGMRQQLLSVTKEKENLQIQLANSKSEIEQLKDDYQTIVVQLQIAYEENKESIEEASKLNATIEKMTKEKETMSAKIKDLQQLLLQTPVFDPNEKASKRELPEKLKKLGSSDSNSEDDTNELGNFKSASNSKSGNKNKKKSNSNSSKSSGKSGNKNKKDAEKDDSDDGDLNKTVLMYQTKLKNLMYEKEALYDNINKLADDNAHLKEQLTNATSTPSAPPIDQPYYIDQLKLLEEDQEYFTEELQRVWKSYDSLLARLNSKSKDDSVYFENSKLHKENDKLHSKLIASRKEIQFLKDIRKSSANSKNSKNSNAKNLNENDIEKIELKKKIDDEKRKNEALIKALREEKAKTAANIVSEDEHRQLFNAKLTIHKLQYELQKVSSKFVHVKGKNKRLKLMMNEKGIQIVRDEMSNEIDAMRDAYESAIDWGYAQQEVLIKEQSEKEALLVKVKILEENLNKISKNDKENFDPHSEEILAEMKSKIEEKLRLQHELDVIRELAIEHLNNDDDNSNLSTTDLVEKAFQSSRKENK